jgi:hypothetical protein
MHSFEGDSRSFFKKMSKNTILTIVVVSSFLTLVMKEKGSFSVSMDFVSFKKNDYESVI